MNIYVQCLKEYLLDKNPVFECSDGETLIDMLYSYYTGIFEWCRCGISIVCRVESITKGSVANIYVWNAFRTFTWGIIITAGSSGGPISVLTEIGKRATKGGRDFDFPSPSGHPHP